MIRMNADYARRLENFRNRKKVKKDLEQAQQPDEKSLNQLTVSVLKEKAKELNIEGADNMKKAELIEAILKVMEPQEDAD
jgi:hypothetical protein